MSPINAVESQINGKSQTDRLADVTEPNTGNVSQVYDSIEKIHDTIAPVWPLNDYVAVNPYMGFAHQEFLATREYLQTLSDVEFFMPVDYYRQQFQHGEMSRADLSAAVDELVSDGVEGAERIDVNQVVAFLKEDSSPSPTADAEFERAANPNRTLFTYLEIVDRHHGSSWCRQISEEISKQCASHYDQGQAKWVGETKELPLFMAWRSEKQIDRTMEVLGVSGFRRFVGQLPYQAYAALSSLLYQLGLPAELWDDYLLCSALTIPGWSAWTKYQHREAEKDGQHCTDLIGLLAMRLAYEVALSKHLNFQVDWNSVAIRHHATSTNESMPTDSDLLRYALLRASEIAFRGRLASKLLGQSAVLERLSKNPKTGKAKQRQIAQMVFCIDVRSERIRRHLEHASPEIETFGFAGFFGLPIEFVELGRSKGSANVPVLISPKFKVHEHVDCGCSETESATERRSTIRFLRKAWMEFQSSAISMFAFVESTGLFFGFKLLARSLGWSPKKTERFDGVEASSCGHLSPSIETLGQQGVTESDQADMAESVLRGIGIVDNFARMVVFCGHGSNVENNPLKAGLDCGACGGHSGEPNARFAAKLLNQSHVRASLAERGIHIPEDTHFVAALHDTTTDQIEFFDRHHVPHSHTGDLEELELRGSNATQLCRQERLLSLPGPDANDLDRRSGDWSEVRPEWGLAGNAAFIAAPRELTQAVSLHGRSFLHSYDHQTDTGYAVLEQIMTAPMVVANWINMQYYASTVDPTHFGSGNKTVHNVVGRFGVFSGNGGDLMTGLPWQSVHDGKQYQHHPLRLLVVLAAPREAISSILAKHENVAQLVNNGWLQLLAVDEAKFYRYTEQQSWEEVNDASMNSLAKLT